jgi:hypothetical protein
MACGFSLGFQGTAQAQGLTVLAYCDATVGSKTTLAQVS